jgi:hypothetical protein
MINISNTIKTRNIACLGSFHLFGGAGVPRQKRLLAKLVGICFGFGFLFQWGGS